MHLTKTHVVFLHPEPLNAILDGRQRYEVRLFKSSYHPAQRARTGDVLLLKETGGEIVGRARVGRAMRLDNLDPDYVRLIADRYEVPGDFDRSYWLSKLDAKHGVILKLEDVEWVHFPSELGPRGTRAAWVADFPHGAEAELLMCRGLPPEHLTPPGALVV